MATIDSLAKEYVEYLKLNFDNPEAASEIINRINSLTYVQTREPLSYDDKLRLVNEMFGEVSPEVKGPNGEFMALESEDSSALVKLMLMIQKGTVGSK